MIAIDAKVRFDAFCYEDNGVKHTPVMVNGTVYAVNYAHKTFHCEYEFEGVKCANLSNSMILVRW